MELAIIIICAIFAFVFQPLVDRIIKEKISRKWVAITLRLFFYWIIFMFLYGIAALLGFKITD